MAQLGQQWGSIAMSMAHNCPEMGLHWQVVGTHLPNLGAALESSSHMFTQQWAAKSSRWKVLGTNIGTVGLHFRHLVQLYGKHWAALCTFWILCFNFWHTLVHIVRPLSNSCSLRYTLLLCVA